MRNNWFIQGLITNGVWALVVAAGGVVVAFLAQNASPLAMPALYGLGASALLSVSILGIKAIGRLPVKRPAIDFGNVEREIRSWLDNFRVGMKNDPTPETYFRFIATMDSGTKILIARPRAEFSGYILLRGEVTPSPDEQKLIAELPDDEITTILCKRLVNRSS